MSNPGLDGHCNKNYRMQYLVKYQNTTQHESSPHSVNVRGQHRQAFVHVDNGEEEEREKEAEEEADYDGKHNHENNACNEGAVEECEKDEIKIWYHQLGRWREEWIEEDAREGSAMFIKWGRGGENGVQCTHAVFEIRWPHHFKNFLKSLFASMSIKVLQGGK